MRLLRTDGTLKFAWVNEEKGPKYAILSHTWGEEEVVFSDMISAGSTGVVSESVRAKKGFQKLRRLCDLASIGGFEYCWIDTACIDKGSSAELGEALNSMYKWYHNSAVCYIFLEDFEWQPSTPASNSKKKACLSRKFGGSRLHLLTCGIGTRLGREIPILSMVPTWMDTSRAHRIPKPQILR